MVRKWYVITVGRKPGIYTSWEEVAPKVLGVSGAVYKSYGTEDEAFRAYGKARMAKLTQVVGAGIEESGSFWSDAVLPSGSRHAEVEAESRENDPLALGKATQSSPKQLVSTRRSVAVNSLNTPPPSSKPQRVVDVYRKTHLEDVEDRMSTLDIASNSQTRRLREESIRTASSSRSTSKDSDKPQKGKEVERVLSGSVQLPATPSPSPAKNGHLDKEELVVLPSSLSFDTENTGPRLHGTASPTRTQVAEIEETSSVTSSPSTGLTYISEQAAVSQRNSPSRSHRTSPRSAAIAPIDEAVPSTPSPSTGITHVVPNQESISSRRSRHHSRPSSRSPSTPAQYCQCDMICPHCLKPRVFFAASCQAPVPLQPPYGYADNYQYPRSPSFGVPLSFSQPTHLANVVYDTVHDPRSPISKTTGVSQQQLGSISPVFGRHSPLLTFDASVSNSSFYQ